MAKQPDKGLRNVKQGTPYGQPVQSITASGQKIQINSGTVLVGIGLEAAITGIVLDDPPRDGLHLEIADKTVAGEAHTVTNASGSGFNGGGASTDVATFSGSLDGILRLVSYGGAWYTVRSVNVSLG